MARSFIVAGAALACSPPPSRRERAAPQRVQVGVLECRGGASVGFIVGSVTHLGCVFRADGVPEDRYVAHHPQGRPRSRHHPGIGAGLGRVCAGGAARRRAISPATMPARRQRDARRRRRRQRAGRRLRQFDRAAAAQRAGPGRHQHCCRYWKAWNCGRGGNHRLRHREIARANAEQRFERGLLVASRARDDSARATRSHAAAQRFSRLPNSGTGGASVPPTQSWAELQPKEAAMGQDVRSPRGPRCIALVGPFQSGKTTLLEAILARTGAISKPAASTPELRSAIPAPRRAHHKMSVEAHRRHHRLHGRQLHLRRLSRLGRVRARHARRAAGGRCRGGGLRGRREEAAAAAAHPARARRARHPAFPVPQQDRQAPASAPRHADDCCSRPRAAAGAAADPDLERTICRSASSISRWSAPTSTANTQSRSRRSWTATISTARRRRASRCWRRSPIMTTS